jgi:hypothetical protein
VTSGLVVVGFTENGGEMFVELGESFQMFDDRFRNNMLILFIIDDNSRGITVPQCP